MTKTKAIASITLFWTILLLPFFLPTKIAYRYEMVLIGSCVILAFIRLNYSVYKMMINKRETSYAAQHMDNK